MKGRMILGVGLAAMVLAPFALSDGPRRARRIWTNDDFEPRQEAPAPASGKAAAQRPDQPLIQTTDPAAMVPIRVPAEGASAPAPEEAAVRAELAQELLRTARARQKAYTETMNITRARLDQETDAFRAEVYRKIQSDTEALIETNRRMIEELEKQAKPAAEQK